MKFTGSETLYARWRKLLRRGCNDWPTQRLTRYGVNVRGYDVRGDDSTDDAPGNPSSIWTPGAPGDDPYGFYRIGRALEDICLEAPHLRPNQDGVHLGGYCEDGVIRTIPASLGIYLFPQNQG